MNKKKLINKWLEALRGGNYSQITGMLHNGTGHCCLGVLAEVAGFKAVRSMADNGQVHYFFDGKDGMPTCDIRDKVGLSYMGAQMLSKINDTRTSTFKQIADILEKEPERFFVKEEEVTKPVKVEPVKIEPVKIETQELVTV